MSGLYTHNVEPTIAIGGPLNIMKHDSGSIILFFGEYKVILDPADVKKIAETASTVL